MRRIGFTRWIGQSGVMAMIVEQLGFAMMPRCPTIACGLISGTTSGIAGSMRNAEELSTTTAPAFAAIGAKRLEMELPAENSAMSTPRKLSSVSSETVSGRFLNGRVLPADRAEASRRSSEAGKRRASRHPISSIPTAPVAPTIATTGEDGRGEAEDKSGLLEPGPPGDPREIRYGP